jgi:nitrite reductase/ring-hydroxylating ferredoxin subunit
VLGDEGEKDGERTYVEVATTDVFEDESIHCVEQNGIKIALIATRGGYSALANRCTHQGGPLCEGEVSHDTIACPWHGAEFDVHTGEPAHPPAVEGVDTFEVRVQDDTIEVKL